MFLLVRYKLRHEDAMLLGLFTSILFYFFGIIGLSGMYFVFNTMAKPSAQKASLYHIDKEEGEETPDSIVSDQPISIRFDELREVAPLADGMTDDDTIIRIAAISAIEETDSTHLFNILTDSRKDTAKEVQYSAHEALKKISDAYMKKIRKLTDVINKSGPDYETFKELADLYAELAHKNIEHPILVRFYRQEAIKYYSDLLKNYQQHRNAILAGLIPVLYENSDYKECIKYCEELYKDPELCSKSIEFKARCLFKIRDIRSLEQFMQKQRNSNLAAINNFIELSEYGLYDG
ncbi:MAG: hypothetical protein U9N83_18460 [Thermodesulfobacteriota bacterium]|nr:hypothetical protein [Thermodesulfobacteriota bacterium]